MSPLSLEKSRMNAEWLKVRKLQGRFGLKIDQSLRRLSTGSQARDLLLLGAFFDVFDDITDGLEFFGVFIRQALRLTSFGHKISTLIMWLKFISSRSKLPLRHGWCPNL